MVAPAGCGKTTLLSHLAAEHQGPVAWCGSPERHIGPGGSLAAWVAPTVACALGESAPPVTGRPDTTVGVDHVLSLLDRWTGPPVLIVMDDVHHLTGTDAEAALGYLVESLPSSTIVALASRVMPGFDLSRARVAGRVADIAADDLRFRTWEVERLFRDVYAEPLHPEDLATLAQRTYGWAAYLQLFHLATARKSAVERRQVLASLSTRSRLVNEYLTRHVMTDLSAELRRFLVRTSVLRRPSGVLCDRLLGCRGSEAMLAELERRQFFTDRIDGAGGYRYHAVLLEHLDSELIAMVGPDAARAEHRRAADLLAEHDLLDDALAAYAKAEDWDAMALLLGHDRQHAADLGWTWLEALPASVIEGDPWLLLARCRRSLAAGALPDALAALRQAEATAASSAAMEVCRRLRAQITAFVEPAAARPDDWVGVVRAALAGEPLRARARAASMSGPFGRLAEAVADMLAGNVPRSVRMLRNVAERADAPPLLAAGALLLASFPDAATGRLPAGAIEDLGEQVAQLGVPWLDRMARVLQAAAGPDAREILDELTETCRREGDAWGEALARFILETGFVHAGRGQPSSLARTAEVCARLGAGTLEVWTRLYQAAAELRSGQAAAAARTANQVRAAAARREIPGAAGAAALVLARAEADGGRAAWAREVLEPMGLWGLWTALLDPGAPVPQRGEAADRGHAGVSGRSALRCLGGFGLVIDGRDIDESALKPKERMALHLLALHAGQAVHREELIEALWPGASPEAGLRRLQVALSSIRRVLEPGIGRGRSRHLLRDADAYRLHLPPDSDVDLWCFSRSVRAADHAADTGDAASEERHLEAALEAYGGSLLPGDGPAEWAVTARTELQSAAARAAARLGRLRLASGDPTGAVAAAQRGLAIDKFRDGLWDLLIRALDRASHPAAAWQARQDYLNVLEELGLKPEAAEV